MQNNGSYPPNDSYPQDLYSPSHFYPTQPGSYPPQQQQKGIWNWYKRQRKGFKIGIGCSVVVLAFLLYAYSLSAMTGSDVSSNSFISQVTPPTAVQTDTVVPTTTQTPTMAPTEVSNQTLAPASNPMTVPGSQPTVHPSQPPAPRRTQRSTPTQVPTSQPIQSLSPQPMPTLTPTQTPTLQPTPIPTQAPTLTPTPTQPPAPQPTQPPAPAPTQSPAQTGVNGNPWGYNFNPGNFIYSPPANFCDYFNCIASFWKSTNGYVDECNDDTYSHSGGVRGACSYHGGEMRPLYSH